MMIAVTGAFSYSGKYITRRLLARGEQVITLTNHPMRPNPFDGKIESYPLRFDNRAEMSTNMRGAQVLVNTYWIRFDRGANTQERAVENTRALIGAAVEAGVSRIVHLSVLNPSIDSHLPYYRGKAQIEKAVRESGLGFAILRPPLVFGDEDILVHNIAWLLRRFPFVLLPGDGSYRLQTIFVDDLAAVAVDSTYQTDKSVFDVVGPDTFTFREMVEVIGRSIGHRRPVIPVPPRLALLATQIIGLLVRDVVLTAHEIEGLMAGLLVSDAAPRCQTRLADWLAENHDKLGLRYSSELARHF